MARVERDEDGELVLNDPDAVGRAVEKHNCRLTFAENADRIEHFRQRFAHRGDKPEDVVIVVLNVDDPNGGTLADALMPGTDWQSFRDRGMVPYARGLAGRSGVQESLKVIDMEASGKLQAFEGLAVVVVDRGVAEVFSTLRINRIDT